MMSVPATEVFRTWRKRSRNSSHDIEKIIRGIGVEMSRLQYLVRFPLLVPLPRLPVAMVHYGEHQLRDVHHNIASDANEKWRHLG
jgi:hypothetical protein